MRDGVVSLSPAYDLLNTTLVLENAKEESALPLNDKKKNLTRKLWLDYFCGERLMLNDSQVRALMDDFQRLVPLFRSMIQRSFLSLDRKRAYWEIVAERYSRLGMLP